MKEKIGIGKLIGLLNEFETPQSGIVFKSYDDYDGTFYGVDIDGETEIVWSDSLICSKKFGWIKWLVENDKIDTDELLGIYWETSQSIWEDNKYELYSEYKRLLMLLSLQDEPIEFLCRLLK